MTTRGRHAVLDAPGFRIDLPVTFPAARSRSARREIGRTRVHFAAWFLRVSGSGFANGPLPCAGGKARRYSMRKRFDGIDDQDAPSGAAAVYGCLAALIAVCLLLAYAFTQLQGAW